ncbi:MAG TPA: hypothetical protein VHL10_01590, partial [Nitrososphaera sp.]|nr:hypothetical protein [Nitrososphaera sp.]
EFDPGVLLLALAAFARGKPRLALSHGDCDAHERGQKRYAQARDFPGEYTKAPWTILLKHRAICAPIKARAQPLSSAAGNQLLDLPLSHCGQVVNVEIAFSAMAHALIAHHLFPVGWAGRCNPQIA